MKLQDAYAAEQAALGSWAVIGYQQPGGDNFTYDENTTTLSVTCKSGTPRKDSKDVVVGCDPKAAEGDNPAEQGVVATSTYSEAWTAENKANLNDCVAGKNWNIAATINQASSKAGMVSYEATVKTAGCTALTPNFTKIGM